MVRKLVISDADVLAQLIRERKREGIDLYDEVWEGTYIMPSMPTNAHQRLVANLDHVFGEVVTMGGLGQSYPGANVSDRPKGWKRNYRVPDLAVVLHSSHAVDCDTHFCGGPDFLVEIQSPGDDTEEKVPFYASISVRELLIIHRDKRTLRLLRLEGEELVLVKPSGLEGKEWLVSEVLPLAFRRAVRKGAVLTQVRRTGAKAGLWTV